MQKILYGNPEKIGDFFLLTLGEEDASLAITAHPAHFAFKRFHKSTKQMSLNVIR